MVVSYEQPEIGEVKQLGFPIKLSRTPAGIDRPAPALGEHTMEVLKEAGYGAEEVQSLVESRAAKGLDTAQTKQEQFLA
jgi:crotonobetainyl-CoA:carnitine CoA-transferase CaiB-like acyl-CoA transferase